MTDKKKLLEVRAEKKAVKPTFKRHGHHRKPGLAENWRRPKGLQNKLRLHKKSRGPPVSTGYRGPVAVRDLSKSGKKVLIAANTKDLLLVEPETHAIIISGKVGDKKRLALLEEASKQGFEITNVDAKTRMDKIKTATTTRGAVRKERVEKQSAREKAVAEKEKKASEKKAADAAKKAQAKTTATTAAKSDEEKTAVKKEQDKVLTQKDQ